MGILSDQDKEKFFQDGYLIVDTGVSAEVIDGAVADLDGKYPGGLNRDGVLEPTRIQDAWKFSENIHRIATAPDVLVMLRELYGREPKPFQTLSFPTGTLQKPHADSVHFNSCPPTFMTGVWVALEDVDEQNGAIEYYPGSHFLPEYNMSDVPAPPLEERYADYEVFIQKVIKDFDLKPARACMKKGHALLWSSNLIHAGGERADLYRSRHSLVTHVYYEGTKYYTPMMTLGTDVCWREPAFIPLEFEKKKRLLSF
jgi:ectoine hydroxylase-related dioxygenase (phytanoyl-CoA dioxygenase family)